MLVSIPLAAFLALAAPPDARASAVSPFVTDEISVVARVDLKALDAPAFARRLLGKEAEGADIRGGTAEVTRYVDALKAGGATELFLLVDLTDMPGFPVAVVPLSGGSDGKAVSRVLTEGVPKIPVRWPAAEVIRGAVVAGTPAALARVRAAQAEARPEVASALAAGGDAVVRLAVVPSATQRRSVEEAMPALPPQVGGGPVTTLTRGMLWASLAVDFEPKPAVRAVVQARDAEAAKALQSLLTASLNQFVQGMQNDPVVGPMVKALGSVKPEAAEGDRVTLSADLGNTAALAAVPLRRAREAARRSQCTNNLKQIGLAMHNYHSSHESFPPAFSAGKDGKPLLSWRVHILPFIEEEKLYREFHLDEPWDSAHNKALISRMPKLYACPDEARSLAAEGKTTYLTPRGAGTIFPGAKGVRINDITDGTSNTLTVVDAADAAAVIWTRPDDWEADPAPDSERLFGHHPGGVNVGFADGSVRFLRDKITPKTLRSFITRKGGEVINYDDL